MKGDSNEFSTFTTESVFLLIYLQLLNVKVIILVI